MPKQEYPLTYLSNYLPAAAAPLALSMLNQYKVHLTITKERKSVLGDYRHAHQDAAHRISVNGNLNQYAFLITLIHELAHLVTFMQYGNRVQAHGKEWKHVYKILLLQYLELEIFPTDIVTALRSSLHDLPASSCADEGLMRILRRYDKKEEGMALVEELSDGALFALDDGKIFRKGKKLRKRFQCQEVKTGKLYLFSPIYEVKKVS
ncbi:MAG: SprT-like domain-containing protein [Chitinophagaceae bacterium]